MLNHRQFVVIGSFMLATLFAASLSQGSVSIAYIDPGWTYEYTGAAAAVGSANNATFTALDGTWNRPSGSQSWDGSGVGGAIGTGNAPGGVSAFLEGETTFVRMQDTGDPRDHSFADPSNRRMRFGHNIGPEAGGKVNFLDTGVTLSFRTRLSTAATGEIDGQYPDAGGEGDGTPAGTPWPTVGNGTVLHDSSRGMFTIRQAGDGGVTGVAATISFSLALSAESPALGSNSGLLTNRLNGTTPITDVTTDSPDGTLQLVSVPEASLDEWHEFWISIVADTSGGGTHRLNVFMDGSSTPTILHVTASSAGAESGLSNYLALGPAATAQMGFTTLTSSRGNWERVRLCWAIWTLTAMLTEPILPLGNQAFLRNPRQQPSLATLMVMAMWMEQTSSRGKRIFHFHRSPAARHPQYPNRKP